MPKNQFGMKHACVGRSHDSQILKKPKKINSSSSHFGNVAHFSHKAKKKKTPIFKQFS